MEISWRIDSQSLAVTVKITLLFTRSIIRKEHRTDRQRARSRQRKWYCNSRRLIANWISLKWPADGQVAQQWITISQFPRRRIIIFILHSLSGLCCCFCCCATSHTGLTLTCWSVLVFLFGRFHVNVQFCSPSLLLSLSLPLTRTYKFLLSSLFHAARLRFTKSN